MRFLYSFLKLLNLLLVVLLLALEIEGSIVLERLLRKLLEPVNCLWDLLNVLHESFVDIVSSNCNSLSSDKSDVLVQKLLFLFFLESSEFLLLLREVLLKLLLSRGAIFPLRLKILSLLLESHLSSTRNNLLCILLDFTHFILFSLSWLRTKLTRETWTSLNCLLGGQLLLDDILKSWALWLLRSSRILFLLHVSLIRSCSTFLWRRNRDNSFVHIEFLCHRNLYKSFWRLFLIGKHLFDISYDLFLSLFLFNISACLALSSSNLRSSSLGWLCQLLLLSSFLFDLVLIHLL